MTIMTGILRRFAIRKMLSFTGQASASTKILVACSIYIFEFIRLAIELEYHFPVPLTVATFSSLKVLAILFQGGIIAVEPRSEDWRRINVIVPDAWYRLENFQKERYCEQVGNLIKRAVVAANVAPNMDHVRVWFVDRFGAEVATPGWFYGYNIVR